MASKLKLASLRVVDHDGNLVAEFQPKSGTWTDAVGTVFSEEESHVLGRVAAGMRHLITLGAGTDSERTVPVKLVATLV